jgi:sister-chromatid-cohesion protein PDS5
LTEILVILVDEASSLPAEVVDIIVAQFLRADPNSNTGVGTKSKKNGSSNLLDEKQSTLVLKELPPAYNMAKTVCNSCPEKMARYVSQYFNDVIMDASSSAIGGGIIKGHRRSTLSRDDWDDDEEQEGPSDEDLKELSKAHKLLRELWRASPAVLQNVIPQLETELSAENIQLRLLATETLGDIVSGIGAAGPPPQNSMDPAAYPQAVLSSTPDSFSTSNILTTPASPQSFSHAHPAAYNSLLSRRIDKSPIIRAAWATGIGRIIITSAGGVGLNQQEEKDLVTNLAEKLVDADERVRIAAIKAVGTFGFRDVVIKLGPLNDGQTGGTVLSNLADRVKDKKHGVRTEAMKTLGRLWGVASGEIAAENESVTSILSFIPSRIFDAFYVNDPDINVLIDHITNEFLLPLSYPPIKSKDSKGENPSQKNGHGSQTNGDHDISMDPDAIRAQRSLLLAKGLDERAKKAFYAMLARQAQWAKVLEAFIKRCEDYNVSDGDLWIVEALT